MTDAGIKSVFKRESQVKGATVEAKEVFLIRSLLRSKKYLSRKTSQNHETLDGQIISDKNMINFTATVEDKFFKFFSTLATSSGQ